MRLKLSVLLLVVAVVWCCPKVRAQQEQHVVIDGMQSPDLIPDDLVYMHVLTTLANHPDQQVYLARLIHLNEMERAQLGAILTGLKTSYDALLASPAAHNRSGPNDAYGRAERELIAATRLKITAVLSQTSNLWFGRYVNSQKRHIKIVIGEGQ